MSRHTNQALGKDYTASPAFTGFPYSDPVPVAYLIDTAVDYVQQGGKLTDGSKGGTPVTTLFFNNGFAGWTSAGAVTLDLGAAVEGDTFEAVGAYSVSYALDGLTAVKLESSDNASTWTTVHDLTGLSVQTVSSGLYFIKLDISAAGAHRYWRLTVTPQGGDSAFLSEIKFWKAN